MVVQGPDREVALRKSAAGLSLGGVGYLEDLVWQKPPPLVEPLLAELFAAKPSDVLTWFHEATWRHLLAQCGSERSAFGDFAEEAPQKKVLSLDTFNFARISLNPQSSRPLRPEQSAEDSPFGASGGIPEARDEMGAAAPMCRESSSKSSEGVVDPMTVSLDDVFGLQQPQPLQMQQMQQQPQSQSAGRSTPLRFFSTNIGALRLPSQGSSRTETSGGVGHTARRFSQSEVSFTMRNQLTNSDRDSLQSVAEAEAGRRRRSVSLFNRDALPLFKYAGNFGSAVVQMAQCSLRSMETVMWGRHSDNDKMEQQDFLVLQPMGRLRLLWDQIFFLSLMYDMWSAPFDLAFGVDASTKPKALQLLDKVTLAVFLFDIFLNFSTGYVSGSGEVVMRRRKIAFQYLKGWFWIDIVATGLDLVLALLLSSDSPDKASSLRVLRTLKAYKHLKLLKLVRSAKLFRSQRMANQVMNYSRVSTYVLMAIKLLQGHVLVIVVVHFNALLWASCHPDWPRDADTTFDESMPRYFESARVIYGAITFGSDVEGHSYGQLGVGMLVNIERTSMVVLLLGWLMWRVLIESNTHASEAVANGLTLQYLKQHHVSTNLQLRVFRTMNELRTLRRQKDEFEKAAESVFPSHLKKHIAFELWSPKLMTLDIFLHVAKWNGIFIKELALYVREEIFPSQVVLFSVGELSDAAYLVLKGILAVTYQAFEAHSDDFSPGMWVGEKALINPKLRRNETIVCKSLAQLMVTPAEAFHNMLTKFDLKSEFKELMTDTLWLGLCGRCGMLGDHYSLTCSITAQEREKQFAAATGYAFTVPAATCLPCIPRQFAAVKRRDTHQSRADLRQFLEVHQIGHLFDHMTRHGILCLGDLNCSTADVLRADPNVQLSEEEEQLLTESAVVAFRKRMHRATDKLMLQANEKNHLLFISHYKAEAGSAAALMQDMLLRILEKDPSSGYRNMDVPIFLDTEDLKDLSDVKRHVVRSHNFVFLLTKDVLTRPWCLLELVTAIKSGTPIHLVKVDQPERAFVYPDEEYYASLRSGKALNSACINFLQGEGVELSDLEKVLRHVFNRIAVPFSPHKSANIRKAELQDILKECRARSNV